MAGNTPLILNKRSQEGLLQFHNQCFNMYNQQWNIREQLRLIDLAYIREADLTQENTRARIMNALGDKTRFQNITIPIVLPQVETAVAYQTSVFLTGNPIFGVVSDPAYMDEALQMETVIENNAVRGGWTRELMMFFRDGFKYGINATEVGWGREVTQAIETDIGFSTSQGKPKEVIWEGNTLKRLDMYNTIFDTRVQPSQMHKDAEFCGYTELMSRIKLKKFIDALPDKMVENIKEAFESGVAGINFGGSTGPNAGYYVPLINPNATLNINAYLGTDWMAWASLSGSDRNTIQYHNNYEVTTLYGRIIPSDFDIRVPGFKTPQVWKFIFVNHRVLIYAERLTNAHGYIPILMGQPLEDGLGYQTKSLADNVQPIQDVTSAISNSNIAARRRAISDRVLYDPSRITDAHINNVNPSAKIPVRPAAYGKPVSDAVYAFPFRDDQAGLNTQEINQYAAMANMISGQNPARQGQFVKGNKTLHEFADVMNHANGRDQMTAILYENQIFTPMKEMIKIDILQYQGGTSLFNRTKERDIAIDPVALRKAILNFKISDGLTPKDKLINADAFTVGVQSISSSPQIGAGYNLAPAFSYLMKTQGADLTPFEKSPQQVAFEQAMGQYQQLVLQLYKQNPEQDPQKLPPAPTPQQYGYNPEANDPSKGPTAVQPNRGIPPQSPTGAIQ